ncbi:short chain dehydrogenase [Colletotrichum karsti]|uniref:Short chain dehydrogenase n=1 Tax=Colletotrichum karsti TaxID=1095194 RepID=A0A9P6I442_9PEZI|nr:short chain dehydrogenase [Colletotrichum karsti]KAF9875884.1 short chain dehydrogenase [Colletotrichum karsti]
MTTQTNIEQPWSLAGKAAIVTGASRGIGKAIAIHLARKGLTNIAITYANNQAAAEDTLEKVRALGVKNAIALKADAAEPEAWPTVVKDSLAGLGVSTIDILINNAVWGSIKEYLPVAQTTPEDFIKCMVGNVYSPVATIVAFLEHAAPKQGGRVINISSVSGRIANAEPTMSYGASKAALDSYTRSFAGHYALERGVTFNSVLVGPTDTDALRGTLEAVGGDFEKHLVSEVTAAPRLGQVEDIAYIVGFLASEEGRWVNGAAVSANGGFKSTIAALG